MGRKHTGMVTLDMYDKVLPMNPLYLVPGRHGDTSGIGPDTTGFYHSFPHSQAESVFQHYCTLVLK